MGRAPYGKRKEVNLIVGMNARRYREEAGYTREEFAELIDVVPRFMYDYEIGATGLSLTKLKKICEVLGISADRLLWDKTDEPITLDERLMHLDPETLELLHKNLISQLEIIEMARKNKNS
ncbi:MAG: helix-turn-helix transcriptional regulator [Clostridia bacterium]|nr:helix-turn-helix transcriptional regulator [Clostridia bacterium]